MSSPSHKMTARSTRCAVRAHCRAVEEEDPRRRQLNIVGLGLLRSGERAALVAEEL
jgi:hypothetical protein